jgi:5'-nucleotidase
MNILLTNDDGLDCPGLLLLAEALKKQTSHRIFIVAPDADRSGFSHSITFLRNPVRLSEKAPDTWTCSGSPADCVIMALLGALPAVPGLVISGINRGANLGTDLVYSGTAAAARQASLAGVPAIALSLAGRGEFYWDMAVSWVLDHFEELRGFWEAGTFVNVNIPNRPEGPAGMIAAPPARRLYDDKISVHKAPGGDSWYFIDQGVITTKPEEGSDCDAVAKNLAAVSPVLIHPAVSLRDTAAGNGGSKG